MKVRSRIERLERETRPPDGSGPLPLHVLTTIMDAGDSGRPLTSAERHELDVHAEAIEVNHPWIRKGLFMIVGPWGGSLQPP